jgi:hypothetical protein
MKSLLLSTFLLLSLVSFSQTRDEIISRYEDGMKKIVITYSGIGNAEKIVKISEYGVGFLLPHNVVTYGSKINSNGISTWGKVKKEIFLNGGAWEAFVETY